MSKKLSVEALVEKEKKRDFEKICHTHGIKMSEAVREFVNYVVETGAYPFKSEITIRVKEEKHKNE